MKTTEINQSIIGKRCECMFTGIMVKGTITEIEECKYSVNVKVVFDSPQQWGDDIYEHDWTWGRKSEISQVNRMKVGGISAHYFLQ